MLLALTPASETVKTELPTTRERRIGGVHWSSPAPFSIRTYDFLRLTTWWPSSDEMTFFGAA